MSLDDFIAKWNGKYIDFDGVYGAQCMDLMHQYCVEVLGISDGSVLAAPSAHDVYVGLPNINGAQLFDKIDNTPTGVPQEGDIVFWINAPYGHVAIFHDGDTNSFKSFDQNFPTGSPCHIQQHNNYTNVGGWLHFKGSQSLQAQLDQVRAERDQNWTMFAALCTALQVPNDKDVALAEIAKLVQLEDVVQEKTRDIDSMTKQVTDLQSQVQDISTKLDNALQVNTEAQKTIADQAASLQNQETIIKQLGDRIEQLKTVQPMNAYGPGDLIILGIKKFFGR